MPRRSGTTTVWSRASSAAIGAHMSPVSPKPWISTTAGPLPPTRTWMVAPSVATSCVLKDDGKAGTPAALAVAMTKAAAPAAATRVMDLNKAVFIGYPFLI